MSTVHFNFGLPTSDRLIPGTCAVKAANGWRLRPAFSISNRETKKPRLRGVVVLHGALDSVVIVLVLLCAPFFSGFLLANSLLSVFLPVFPQRNCFVFPSSSSVHHHHHPHEVDEYKATVVPEFADVNVINGLPDPSLKVDQD